MFYCAQFEPQQPCLEQPLAHEKHPNKKTPAQLHAQWYGHNLKFHEHQPLFI